jgi:hypothetical protein
VCFDIRSRVTNIGHKQQKIQWFQPGWLSACTTLKRNQMVEWRKKTPPPPPL